VVSGLLVVFANAPQESKNDCGSSNGHRDEDPGHGLPPGQGGRAWRLHALRHFEPPRDNMEGEVGALTQRSKECQEKARKQSLRGQCRAIKAMA